MKRPLQNILILGSDGRIGSLLRNHLRARLPYARIMGSTRGQIPAADATHTDWLIFDPFKDDWGQLPQFDLVVNAIGAIKETKEMPYSRIHEGLTSLLLTHREGLGQPRILQISALGARPDHEVNFLATKGRADAMLLAEPDTLVVRPSIVCTPETMLQKKLEQLLQIAKLGFGKLLVPSGFPDSHVQPIYPEDLGTLCVNAALTPGLHGIVEAVGPYPITFGEILTWMAETRGQKLKLVAVPREVIEGFVKHFVSVWFPGTLNYDQFRLLFQDNVGNPASGAAILGRMTKDTAPFWKQVEVLEAADAGKRLAQSKATDFADDGIIV